MSVRALQQRMAVFIRTEASFSGSAPSKEGDQWPPMAMASSLPRIPTRNWKQRSSNGLQDAGKPLSALKEAHAADKARDIRWANSTQQSIQQWNRTETHHSQLPNTDRNFRFGYIMSLKYHLVVMLVAGINMIQPQIRNLIAYLLPLPDKKRRPLWLNTIKRADWTETIVKNARVCSTHFLSEKVQ